MDHFFIYAKEMPQTSNATKTQLKVRDTCQSQRNNTKLKRNHTKIGKTKGLLILFLNGIPMTF